MRSREGRRPESPLMLLLLFISAIKSARHDGGRADHAVPDASARHVLRRRRRRDDGVLIPQQRPIVEIAVVRLFADATKEYVTLVNPLRDVGPAHVHGLTADDV